MLSYSTNAYTYIIEIKQDTRTFYNVHEHIRITSVNSSRFLLRLTHSVETGNYENNARKYLYDYKNLLYYTITAIEFDPNRYGF